MASSNRLKSWQVYNPCQILSSREMTVNNVLGDNFNSLTELVEALESLSFGPAADVHMEPDTVLRAWQAFMVSGNFDGTGDTLHFIGEAQNGGRVCSPVQHLDNVKRIAITRSGRRYHFEGPPGVNKDAQYVWQRWIAHNGNPSVVEITQSVYNSFE